MRSSSVIKGCEPASITVFDLGGLSSFLAAPGCGAGELLDAGAGGREAAPEVLEAAARACLAEAEERARELEREGFSAGYAAGEEAGRDAGRAALDEERDRFRSLLEQASGLPERLFSEYREWFMDLALTIGKTLARCELSAHPEGLSRLLSEALEAARGAAPRLTIRLHPDDAALLAGAGALPKMSEGASIAVRSDPECERGGFWLESEGRVIDATLGARLELLSEAFRS